MDERCFDKFCLSNDTLKEMKNTLLVKNHNFNSTWFLINGKSRYNKAEVDASCVEKSTESEVECNNTRAEDASLENQFFFSQVVKPIHKQIESGSELSTDNVIKYSIEYLEHFNKKYDFLSFENLSNEHLSTVFEALKNNLSENGIHNLCHFVCNMPTEESLMLLPTFCTKFLLPKIIELEKDSVLIKNGICDCVNKFPNEIQDLVFTKILNSDLKNIYIIMALLKTFGIQNYSTLLSEFANHTQELKQWHFPILEMFLSSKTDKISREKLLKLCLNKAMTFSKDKGYAKLIHTFAKINAPFSKEEALILEEIAALNQTVYKQLIEKYSKPRN